MEYIIRPCHIDEQDQALEIEREVWAPFNWEATGAVGTSYDPELHFVAEDEQGALVATIDGCGLAWDGDPDHLPDGGWTDVILSADQGFDYQPAYACALGASVLPQTQGSGLAGRLLEALRDAALAKGYEALVAPVRPVARWRMPHLSLSEYAQKRLSDGRHFDPWVRLHEAIGGKIIFWSEASALFEGTRSDWERWTKMRLPDDGLILVDGAIDYLKIESGIGTLAEPSIWILHSTSQQHTSV